MLKDGATGAEKKNFTFVLPVENIDRKFAQIIIEIIITIKKKKKIWMRAKKLWLTFSGRKERG